MLYSAYDYDLAVWRSIKEVPSYLVWSILLCNQRSLCLSCVCFFFLEGQVRPDSDQIWPNQTRYQTYSGDIETTDDQTIIAFHSCLFHLLCALNKFSILLQPDLMIPDSDFSERFLTKPVTVLNTSYCKLVSLCIIDLSLISAKSFH